MQHHSDLKTPEITPVTALAGEPASLPATQIIKASVLEFAALQAKVSYANAIVHEEWNSPERRGVALENAAMVKKSCIGLESQLSPVLLEELARSGPVTSIQKVIDDSLNEFSVRLRKLQAEPAADFSKLPQGIQPIDVRVSPYLGRTLNSEELIAAVEVVSGLDQSAKQAFVETLQAPLLNQAHRLIALADALHFANTQGLIGEKKNNYRKEEDNLTVTWTSIPSTMTRCYIPSGKYENIVCSLGNDGELWGIHLTSNLDMGKKLWAQFRDGKIKQIQIFKGKREPTHILDLK